MPRRRSAQRRSARRAATRLPSHGDTSQPSSTSGRPLDRHGFRDPATHGCQRALSTSGWDLIRADLRWGGAGRDPPTDRGGTVAHEPGDAEADAACHRPQHECGPGKLRAIRVENRPRISLPDCRVRRPDEPLRDHRAENARDPGLEVPDPLSREHPAHPRLCHVGTVPGPVCISGRSVTAPWPARRTDADRRSVAGGHRIVQADLRRPTAGGSGRVSRAWLLLFSDTSRGRGARRRAAGSRTMRSLSRGGVQRCDRGGHGEPGHEIAAQPAPLIGTNPADDRHKTPSVRATRSVPSTVTIDERRTRAGAAALESRSRAASRARPLVLQAGWGRRNGRGLRRRRRARSRNPDRAADRPSVPVVIVPLDSYYGEPLEPGGGRWRT